MLSATCQGTSFVAQQDGDRGLLVGAPAPLRADGQPPGGPTASSGPSWEELKARGAEATRFDGLGCSRF